MNLFGKTIQELQDITDDLSLPSFSAVQLADWLYKKKVDSIDKMTNISKAARNKIKENYSIILSSPEKVHLSADGTKKYLFRIKDDKYIESAYIPEKKRHTLCISSQIGCKRNCLFCMTGKQGFQGNLNTAEILNQIVSIPERDKLTNIVYMGMGEPFDNLPEVLKSLEILTANYGFETSPKRITISTIGLLPSLKTFIESSNCHLAVSLHSPFHEERKHLLPIESVYPIEKVINMLKAFDFSRQRRISFEYILFKEFNDSVKHVNNLASLLNGLKCRINLIRYHPIPNMFLEPSDEETIQEFRERLNKKGITTTIRASRGLDIFAACGLLSTKELIKL